MLKNSFLLHCQIIAIVCASAARAIWSIHSSSGLGASGMAYANLQGAHSSCCSKAETLIIEAVHFTGTPCVGKWE
jgi:hypothetical protein